MTAPSTELLRAVLEQAGLAFTLHEGGAPRATLRLVGDDGGALAVTVDLAADALRLSAHDVFRAPADATTLWQVNELNQRLAPARVYLPAAGGFAASVSLYAGGGPPDPAAVAFAARQLLQLRRVRMLDELVVDAPPGGAAVLLDAFEDALARLGLQPTRLHDGGVVAIRLVEPDGHDALIELFAVEDRLLLVRGRHPHAHVVPRDAESATVLQRLNERLAFGAAAVADEGWPYFLAALPAAWTVASDGLAQWLVDGALSALTAIDRDFHGLAHP